MDFEDESEGTQKLFALAGPLFEIIQRGQVLVIDELDRSLHELLVRQFVRLFQDPEINANGAQLIFTSHDSSLLEGGLLRRDQIWFAEKSNDLASYLVPLTDYSARKDEALDRGYRAGRFGAIPVLPPRLKIAKVEIG
jgi:AAA15 family ATPase/GTPase